MSKPLKIGIIQTGRVGDLVLITPAFRLIKEKYPDSNLTLLAGENNYQVALHNPYINRILIYKKRFFNVISLIFTLKTSNFDFWIVPKDHYSTESRIISILTNAKNKIGYNHPEKKRVFNIDLPDSKHIVHHTQIALNSITPLGISIPDEIPVPELYFSDNEIFSNQINKLLELNTFIFLNISASMHHKTWSADKWSSFIEQTELHKENLIINYTEKEKEQFSLIKKNFPFINEHNAKSIRDVMKLISHSKYVITPDTAIVHIASAFKKPIFALYSGLEEFYIKFKPTTPIYKTVRAFPYDHGIKSIEPDFAVKQFKEFLTLI